MKSFELNNIFLGDISIKQVKDIAFGASLLRKIHGKDAKIEDWKDNKRHLEYKVTLPHVPPMMKRFLHGNEIKMSTLQTIKQETETRLDIENNVKLNCIGSNFIHVKPQFSVVRDVAKKQTNFCAKVSVKVWAPPLLSNLAETFMIIQAEKDLLNYARIILDNI
jgi:hypothetical protein